MYARGGQRHDLTRLPNPVEGRAKKHTDRMDRQPESAQTGSSASPDRSAASLLDQALAHHRAGRTAEAERLYRQVLARDPRHGDALHLLGMLAGQAGRHDTAAALIRQAVAVNGGQPYYHLHLGLAARNLGRLDEAEASYRRALDLKPDLVEAHHGLGMVLQAFGRPAEAVASYDRALACNPSLPETFVRRGSALMALGRPHEAVASHDRALALRPDFPEAHACRATALHVCSRLDEALEAYDRALHLNPGLAPAHSDRGIILLARARIEEALSSFDRAIALLPNLAEAHNNRGSALHELGRYQEALASFDRAIVLQPRFPEAYCGRGNVHQALGNHADALAEFDRALALAPNHAPAHGGRATTLRNQGKFHEAVQSFDRALALEPGNAVTHRNRGITLRNRGMLAEAVASFENAAALAPGSFEHACLARLSLPVILPTAEGIDDQRRRYRASIEELMRHPGALAQPSTADTGFTFYLAYHGVDDRATMEAMARLYRAKCPALGFEAPHVGTWAAPEGRRIRLGFASSYFRNHTIGKLYRGLLGALDRTLLDITLIHTSPVGKDAVAEEMDALADRSLRLRPTLAVSQRAIADQNLDILLYPDIGMSRDSYFLAFARLAPVQALSWGHPMTSGLNTLDYFLSAREMEPPDADLHYSERLVRLNRLPCYYERPPAPAANLSRRELGLPASGTLYGCPQSLYKFHPDFDAVLAEIVNGDPDGHIVALEGIDPNWSDLLRRRWAESHPSLVQRVHFLPRVSTDRFMALLASLDVLLDPPHFGSGNTLYEAMTFGTPIVTWPGRFMRGRIVAAAYRQMGVAHPPIAATLGDYAPLALALGRDPARREAVRRASLAAADALFADRQVAGDFEAFAVAALAAAARGDRLAAGWQPTLP